MRYGYQTSDFGRRNPLKSIVVFLVGLLASGILSFCLLTQGEVPDGKDEGGYYKFKKICIESHKERVLQPTLIGKQWYYLWRTKNVCDKYGKEKVYLEIKDIKKSWLKENHKSY